MASAMFNLRATQNIEVALSQAIDPNLSLALHFSAGLDGGAPGTLTYGGCVKLDEATTITAKVDTHGKVAGLLQVGSWLGSDQSVCVCLRSFRLVFCSTSSSPTPR